MINMNFGLNILPTVTNTYSLGDSNHKWNIFANTINGQNLSSTLLPTVTAQNNGQILKVDNGAWTVGEAPTSLPPISILDNNSILQVQNGNWAVLPLSGMTGANSSSNGEAGLVPAPTSSDIDKFLSGDGTWKSGGLPMVVLSYGSSTWNDFINAYNNNVIVYCRASSNANPASGTQGRMAFMAYVNNASSPTEVEFQYYRSISSHTSSQMDDQVFVYKLNSSGTWSVTIRDASLKQIKIGTGDAASVSYSSNIITLKGGLPAVTASDNGKILQVVDGVWTAVTPS